MYGVCGGGSHGILRRARLLLRTSFNHRVGNRLGKLVRLLVCVSSKPWCHRARRRRSLQLLSLPVPPVVPPPCRTPVRRDEGALAIGLSWAVVRRVECRIRAAACSKKIKYIYIYIYSTQKKDEKERGSGPVGGTLKPRPPLTYTAARSFPLVAVVRTPFFKHTSGCLN